MLEGYLLRADNKAMIFGIGLSKTGTWSLHRALEALGYSSIHFPSPDLMIAGRFNEALAGFDAATDISVSAVFERLDHAYPGSRFILTVRDLDPWLRSVGGHVDRRDAPAYHAPGGARTLRERLYGSSAFDRASYARGFEAFHRRVHAHFARRESDLLTMDVCAGAGWESLCPFLGVLVPRVPFPHANPTHFRATSMMEVKGLPGFSDHARDRETLGVTQREVKLGNALGDRDLARAAGEADHRPAVELDRDLHIRP